MSWLPISILPTKNTPVSIGASETNSAASKEVHLTSEGARRLRIDLFNGQTTVAVGITAKLQTSTGYGIWNDKATVAITDKLANGTFTVTPATNVVAEAAHGYTSGQSIVVGSSSALPAGLSADTAYWVEVIGAGSYYLHSGPQLSPSTLVDITDTGTGTHSSYPMTQFSIALEDSEAGAGGQDYTPLEHKARVVVSSGAGDSSTIIDVLLTMER